jgi:Fe-S cluster assembly protein SufD
LASPATAEPAFLAARRERAAALSATLSLPQFKGHPGWEFTDISGLDLAAFPPANGSAPDGATAPEPMFAPDAVAELRQVDGRVPQLTGTLPDGVIVASLQQAAAHHPELVQRHLGTVVDSQDVFVARSCSPRCTRRRRPSSPAAR